MTGNPRKRNEKGAQALEKASENIDAALAALVRYLARQAAEKDYAACATSEILVTDEMAEPEAGI